MRAFLRFLQTFLLSCAVARAAGVHPSLPAIGSLDGLGVNIHFTDPQPGELEMIKAAGFQWVRTDFAWAGTEREAGRYDFAAYDRLAAALQKNGLRAVFILDYGNPLYDDGLAPHTDAGRAAFAKWAAAALGHFQGRGFLWELWNEPNIAQFWKPQPDVQQYIALAKAVAAEIRNPQTRPERSAAKSNGSEIRNEAFIGPACSTIDLPFLEECMKAGLLEFFDGVSVHPYRQTAPETVEEEYRSVRLLIRKYAPKDKTIPVLSGEWGYSTGWKDCDEEKQAKYLARQFLTNIANDVPLSIWYDWRDDGDDPKEPEHHFGLVRNRYRAGEKEVYEPKPAYRAAQTLTTQLAGMQFNKRLGMGREAYYDVLFSKGKDLRVVVWKTIKAEPMKPYIEGRPGKFATMDYLGQPRQNLSPREDNSRMVNVPLTTSPLYLMPEAPDDVLRLAAAWPRAPLEIVAEPGKFVRLNQNFTNPLDRPIDFFSRGVELSPGAEFKGSQELGPSQNEITTFSLNLVVPNLCSLSQTTYLVSMRPMRLTVAPVVEETLPIRIENPSGDPFRGVVELDPEVLSNAAPEFEPLSAKLKGAPVLFKEGQREQIVTIPIGHLPPASYVGVLRLYEGDENTVMQLLSSEEFGRVSVSIADASFKCRRVDDFMRLLKMNVADAYTIHADGDPAVSSNFSLTVKPGPDGLIAQPFSALYLTYQSDAGWKFMQITPLGAQLHVMEGSPTRFGLWLHGDTKGCAARIRFVDATGQTFQADGPKIDWKGWRYVSFPMQSTEDKPLAHWGGANDGAIHYPIKWDTIFLLDNVSREAIEGEVYLSAPTLIY